MRNIAAEKLVRIGVTNVNVAASDNDKCFRERYIPARAMKLK